MICCPQAYSGSLIHLSTLLWLGFGHPSNLWSKKHVTASLLMLAATSNHFPHPYQTFAKCLSTFYAVHRHRVAALHSYTSLIGPGCGHFGRAVPVGGLKNRSSGLSLKWSTRTSESATLGVFQLHAFYCWRRTAVGYCVAVLLPQKLMALSLSAVITVGGENVVMPQIIDTRRKLSVTARNGMKPLCGGSVLEMLSPCSCPRPGSVIGEWPWWTVCSW